MSDLDLDTFAADLWAFAEENWLLFKRWAEKRGYSEDEAERAGTQLNKKAGRMG